MMAAEEVSLVPKGDGSSSEHSHGDDPNVPLSAEFALGLLLGHAQPSSMEISKLASDRRSYGLAWVILVSLKKKNVDLPFFDSLELSIHQELPLSVVMYPQKIALLLVSLPETTEKLSFPGEYAQFLELIPADALAFLQSLVVKDVLSSPDGILQLIFWMSWCDLIGLQHLHLDMGERGPEEDRDVYVQALAGGLTRSVVPQLKLFELYGRACGEKGTRAVLSALKSEERPPVEELRMDVVEMARPDADAICIGGFPFLKGLQVIDNAADTLLDALLRKEAVVRFLSEANGFFLGLERGNFPRLRSLTLPASMRGRGGVLEALGRAAAAKRLQQLEALSFASEFYPYRKGGFAQFAQALGAGQMPHLKRLCIPLFDDCIVALTGAFALNDLPALEELEVLSAFRKGGLKAFAEGLGPNTLPSLCRLEFGCLGTWPGRLIDEDTDALGLALREGRLPALKRLCVRGVGKVIRPLLGADWGGRGELVRLVIEDSDTLDFSAFDGSEGSASSPASLFGSNSSLAD
uniref:Uncharacterized protein n=1 Tax=Chromera velia CCMP2878 TaxID=1169474 RepID=A0A0G4H1M9_9ALVE|eukprot:Cvel_24330.t1-p1 / transcript=Cvel_24330.t1 / gene=Cvel_24330 / organism=Chromera_velia_CCMP2878 / gene_product=hypothetical protein / transcript_product=hypothetical protein / location=Cvel_scaffold2616:15038-18352(-) / protein_length=521 / sequence_SO=supercontig / SO=protein_coding / is_pseudo=false